MAKQQLLLRLKILLISLFVANTHDTILCFSSRGKVYWLKVYALPQAGRTARGKPIVNLLPLQEDERINVVLPVKDYTAKMHMWLWWQAAVR